MSKDLLADLIEMVRLTAEMARRTEMYFSYEQGGPKHTAIQNARVDITNTHAKLLAAQELPAESLTDEHNIGA